MKYYLLPLFCSLFVITNLSAINVEFHFDDNNGTNLNATANTGTSSGAWNFGGAQASTRSANSGHLNVGYTHYYKGLFNGQLDDGTVTRRYTLDNAITSGGDWSFTAVLDSWALNHAVPGASTGRGIQFAVEESIGNSAKLSFISNSTNDGASHFAQVRSESSGGVAGTYGGKTGMNINRTGYATSNDTTDNADLTVQFNGNLNTGVWSSRVNYGVGVSQNANNQYLDDTSLWYDLTTDGTGLTSISSITIAALNPLGAAWGSATAGGNAHNYVTIDHIGLTVVPEPSTYALLAGFAAFLFVAIKRRK
tara:strand:- start:1846 stop:2769 length:924 start_codon:yes stop_codon:yes gene_type:complete